MSVRAEVLLIDDFESSASLERWEGHAELSALYSSHGRHSLAVAGSESVRLKIPPRDWSRFDRLEFDIYNPNQGILFAGFQMWDGEAGSDSALERVGQGYENKRKLILIPGWTHVQVSLVDLQVNNGDRALRLSDIVHLSFTFPDAAEPLYLDNVRLIAGPEPAASASRTQAHDVALRVEGRWVTSDLAGPRTAIVEPQEAASMRAEAETALERLRRKLEAADVMGIPALYDEIPLIVGLIGLEVRAALPWYKDAEKRADMYAYIARTCREAAENLEGLLSSRSGSKVLSAPAVPDYTRISIGKGNFVGPDGKPVLLLSAHGTDTALVTERASDRLSRFIAPIDYTSETFSVGGGSRYDIETSPVYRVHKEDPDTHRVGWDGWCGHLIKDVWAMGGRKENVVICLEHPKIKAAIREYIETHAPEWRDDPHYLFNNMAYELMYICYCDRSVEMYCVWLAEEHGSVDALNDKWRTTYASFDEIRPPAVKNARPLPGTNPGAWYDWARFNQERFTRHLEWVKAQIQEVAPGMPVTCGGISSMFSGGHTTSGIDEEQIVRRVDDVILTEAGRALYKTDLQYSLGEGLKPIVDPEHSGPISELLPHYIRGSRVIGFYYWGARLGFEFPHLWNASIPHSWARSLGDVAEFLRVSLDVRRLASEISSFADAPSEVKILYSHTNMRQTPPELVGNASTPYLDELLKVYESSRYLDTRPLFITETQIREGKLAGNRLLIVPACRHLPDDVVQAIFSFAGQGGSVIVTPESLLSDEYARPIDALSRLGIQVEGVTLPAAVAGGLEQGYDQNLLRTVRYDAGPSRHIHPQPRDVMAGLTHALKGSGAVQTWRVGEGVEVLGTFADDSPAVTLTRAGRGRIYALATSLDGEAYTELFDRIASAARVSRPIRVTTQGGARPKGIEARSVKYQGDWLLYVYNATDDAQGLRIETEEMIVDVVELRSMNRLSERAFAIAPRATLVYRLYTDAANKEDLSVGYH